MPPRSERCARRTASSSARRTWTSSGSGPSAPTPLTESRCNPYDVERSCGGSSGGAAAITALLRQACGPGGVHRRFDLLPRFVLRGDRVHPDLWPGLALRPDRLRQLAGQDRSRRPKRRATSSDSFPSSPDRTRRTRPPASSQTWSLADSRSRASRCRRRRCRTSTRRCCRRSRRRWTN